MPYLSESELVLPRIDFHGNPTPDNFFHTLPDKNGNPRTINGFMGDDWMKPFLYQLGWNTRGFGIELGSFVGLSTCLIAMGMRDSAWQEGKMICVDWWKDGYLGMTDMLQKFKDNISAFGVEKYINLYQGSCEDPKLVPPVKAEWLWLDASHYRAELRVNIDIYYPMVKPKGLILWHDTHMEEVLLHIEEVKSQFGITPVITNRPDFQVWRKP